MDIASTSAAATFVPNTASHIPARSMSEVLQSGCNNAEVNFEKILCSDTPSTTAAAYRDLAQKACAHFMPGVDPRSVAAVANNPSTDGKYQAQLVINLFMLSMVPGIDSVESYKSAEHSIKKALGENVKNIRGKKNNPAGVHQDYGKDGGLYKRGKKIEKLIGEVLMDRPEARELTKDNLRDMYLHDGLPKAFNQRHGGAEFQLTAEGVKQIRARGNASDLAMRKLDDQGRLWLTNERPSDNFARLINRSLALLDLDMPEKTAPRQAARTGGEKGRIRSAPDALENDRAWPSTAGINMRGGNARVGDIDVNVDTGSMSEVFAKALDLMAGMHRHNVSLTQQLLAVRNPDSAGVPRHSRSEIDVVTAERVVSDVDSEGQPGERLNLETPFLQFSTKVDDSVEWTEIPARDDDANVVDAQAHEAVNVVTTGAQQLGQSSRISFSDSDESDSGVEDDIPAPPPMPPSFFSPDMDDSVKANMASVMAELQKRLTEGLNLRASTIPVEPAFAQRRDSVQSNTSLASIRALPSRRRSESSDSNRNSFQAADRLFENELTVGRSASATMNAVDTTRLRTSDNLRDSNIAASRPLLSGAQTGFPRAVTDDGPATDFLMARRLELKPIGARDGSAQVAPGRASISADAAFDVGSENMFAAVDRSSRATTPDIGTGVDTMSMDQTQNLQRSDSLSELARLPSMVPFNARGKAKIHAPVIADNSFFGSLASGTHMKGRPWQN